MIELNKCPLFETVPTHDKRKKRTADCNFENDPKIPSHHILDA